MKRIVGLAGVEEQVVARLGSDLAVAARHLVVLVVVYCCPAAELRSALRAFLPPQPLSPSATV